MNAEEVAIEGATKGLTDLANNMHQHENNNAGGKTENNSVLQEIRDGLFQVQQQVNNQGQQLANNMRQPFQQSNNGNNNQNGGNGRNNYNNRNGGGLGNNGNRHGTGNRNGGRNGNSRNNNGNNNSYNKNGYNGNDGGGGNDLNFEKGMNTTTTAICVATTSHNGTNAKLPTAP